MRVYNVILINIHSFSRRPRSGRDCFGEAISPVYHSSLCQVPTQYSSIFHYPAPPHQLHSTGIKFYLAGGPPLTHQRCPHCIHLWWGNIGSLVLSWLTQHWASIVSPNSLSVGGPTFPRRTNSGWPTLDPPTWVHCDHIIHGGPMLAQHCHASWDRKCITLDLKDL